MPVIGHHDETITGLEPRRRDVVFGARLGSGHDAFGRAERVDERDTGQVAEQPPLRLRAPGDARGGDRAQARQVPAFRSRVESLEEGTSERVADDGEHLDVVAFNGAPDALRIEAETVEEDDRPAAGERRQRDEQARSVHERARRQTRGRGLARARRTSRRCAT